PEVFSAFTPYPGSESGVTVATGMVDAGSGRETIVTAPGAGDSARVRTWRYDLYTPTARSLATGKVAEHAHKPNEPRMTSEFLAYDEKYTGGVALSTGWVAGAEGGAKSIVTGQLAGDGTVRVWSSGSILDGQPAMYLQSANHHEETVTFAQTASFAPFAGATPGLTVATTSTTSGADLLVSGTAQGAAEVRKYSLGRAAPEVTALVPTLLTMLPAVPGMTGPLPLGGR
ncbi:MAG: copper oxidase, partial [Mycobacterium sp.]